MFEGMKNFEEKNAGQHTHHVGDELIS